MDWTQVFTIIGVLGALLFYVLNRIEGDINKLSTRLDGHATRIDQLYRAMLDIMKERK